MKNKQVIFSTRNPRLLRIEKKNNKLTNTIKTYSVIRGEILRTQITQLYLKERRLFLA